MFFCWEAPPLNYIFLENISPQQPLLVWYEKLTLTLVFVFLGLGFIARTKPTKTFVTLLFFAKTFPQSWYFQQKRVCGKRVPGSKVTAHPICGVTLLLDTRSP